MQKTHQQKAGRCDSVHLVFPFPVWKIFVYFHPDICQNPSEGCGFEEVLRWWITLTPWSNTLTGLVGDYSSSCIIPICPSCLWKQDRFRDWPRFRRKFLGKVGQSLWRLRECAKVCDSQIARQLPPSQDPGCSAHTYSLKQFLKNVKQSEYKQSGGRVSLLAQKPQRGLKKIKVGSKMIYDSRCQFSLVSLTKTIVHRSVTRHPSSGKTHGRRLLAEMMTFIHTTWSDL